MISSAHIHFLGVTKIVPCIVPLLHSNLEHFHHFPKEAQSPSAVVPSSLLSYPRESLIFSSCPWVCVFRNHLAHDFSFKPLWLDNSIWVFMCVETGATFFPSSAVSEMVLLCSLGCPKTHYIVQHGLKLMANHLPNPLKCWIASMSLSHLATSFPFIAR